MPCQARSVRLCGTVVGTCQWYRGMHTCVCDTVEGTCQWYRGMHTCVCDTVVGTCYWYRGRGMPVPSWTWAVTSARQSLISSSLVESLLCIQYLVPGKIIFQLFPNIKLFYSLSRPANYQTCRHCKHYPVQTLIAQTQWSWHPCRYFGHKREETNTWG